MSGPITFEDYREAARRRLPRVIFDYVDGGSYTETTLRRNTEAFGEVKLRQRVLRDVSKVSLATELFGQSLSMPLLLAPIGMGGFTRRRGEVQAARAAEAAGVPFCLSTVSVCGLEEVAAGCASPAWFQLYMAKDRDYMRVLLARARGLGVKVLVFTVDLPVPGARYRDIRSGLNGGLSPWGQVLRGLDGLSHPAWLWDVWLQGRPHVFGNLAEAIPDARGLADFWGWVRSNFDASVTWADLHWLRQHWDGPIVLKGVLDPEDARSAAKAGMDGVIVSNHGGRQLDGALAAIEALPAVVGAVGDRLTVLMDGGVRSGLDVAKALALGARACLIGRPWVFALAAGGQAGVEAMLATWRSELTTALALTGVTDVLTAGPEMLVR